MARNNPDRIPTGIPTFDHICDSGLPTGSLVLLLGDVGAGHNEFAYTTMAALSMAKYDPELAIFSHLQLDDVKIPDNLHYITFSRTEDFIKREVKSYFDSEFYDAFVEHVTFKDFSSYYFKNSIIPSSWTGTKAKSLLECDTRNNGSDVMRELVHYLDENAKDSVVIIDSLTDLAISQNINAADLVDAIKGLQRISKDWNGIIYLVLTDDIVPKSQQQTFVESVDGVIMFEWGRSVKSSKRPRYMYLEKFTSLLPHIHREKIARFITDITPAGLTVCDWELIA